MSNQHHPVVPILPASGVQLHLPAGTTTCNMKKKVSMARTTEPMKQCMIKKHNWDEETFLDIDWCPARSEWRKQFMSGLCKKLNSLGTETGLMEMMLAGVKSALTRQQFRVPQELRNSAAAQEAMGWIHLFKGRISKQWINRQRDHIGDKATTKNNALNWATTVTDHFFTQWFKVWDQRNLDRHGHD